MKKALYTPALMALTLISTQALAEIASGTSGNITWSISDDGVLNISGTGTMPNYYQYVQSGIATRSPWKDYAENINSINVSEGITNISEHAFANLTNVTSVNLPTTITKLESNAFYGNKLESVTIPKSVTQLSGSPFAGVPTLTSVTFEEGTQIQTLGNYALYGTGITSFEIPATVTSIGQGLFQGVNSLQTVTFAEGSQITSIPNNAFTGTGITSIEIPASVTTIGNQAFANVTNLENVTFAAGSQLTSIGDAAFYGSHLTNIEIPASVTEIGAQAFRGATQLTSITFDEGSQLTTIGGGAFVDCVNLKSIAFPSSVTTIGDESTFLPTNYKMERMFIPDSLVSYNSHLFYAVSNTGTVYCSKAQEEMCKSKVYARWGSNAAYYASQFPNLVQIYEVDKTCDEDGKCTYNSYTINGQTYTSYNEMLAALGFPVPAPKENRMVKNADGSYSVFDPNGNFIGFRGKRIYTVEEASRLSKPTGNTFKLRYK